MSVINLSSQRGQRRTYAFDAVDAERQSERVYAIAFDLDTALLEQHYPTGNWRNAYDDIARELLQHGFQRQQGSVYFGKKGTNSVGCVLAAQALSKRYPWFVVCVRDMRMLRVEEQNDLMPAIGQLDLPLGNAGSRS